MFFKIDFICFRGEAGSLLVLLISGRNVQACNTIPLNAGHQECEACVKIRLNSSRVLKWKALGLRPVKTALGGSQALIHREDEICFGKPASFLRDQRRD